MADKWQIWYPHKIDAWQGSATIQTFSDAAYRGYHNLIMAQFQAEDGMLPDDDRALAKESRLGERWPQYAEEIRAHLKTDVPGRVYSATQYELWKEAHGKHLDYLERMEAARLAKALRKAQDNGQLNTQSNAQGNAQPVDSPTHNSVESLTVTVTETVTEKEIQKTSAAASAALIPDEPVVPAMWEGQPLALETVSGELWPVPAADCVAWADAYPGVNVLNELLKMREWLRANSKNRKTAGGMRRFIVNWLGRAQDRSRPAGGASNGYGNRGQARTDGNLTAARIAADRMASRIADSVGGSARS
jgi:hypothetical protein